MGQKISLWILVIFFVIAGALHFINPQAYYPLIPNYIPLPKLINFISGGLEVILGGAMLSARFRPHAGWGLIALMLLFIPSHVHFIQQGGCIEDALCFPQWVAWVRLIIIHPLLIAWIWYCKNFQGRAI